MYMQVATKCVTFSDNITVQSYDSPYTLPGFWLQSRKTSVDHSKKDITELSQPPPSQNTSLNRVLNPTEQVTTTLHLAIIAEF